MPKVNKETMTVTNTDINTAMTRLLGLMQGYVDGDNLMKSGTSQLKYPAENISDYPSSVKPIVADKYIAAKDTDSLETIESLYTALDANRDYTVLKGSITMSWIGGVEKVTNSSWGFYSPRFNPKDVQENAERAISSPSLRTIVIPKSPNVVPILDASGRYVFTPYVRVKHNLEDKTSGTDYARVEIVVDDPVNTPEYIEFNIRNFFDLKANPWVEGKYLSVFIDVEILCEVLS